MVLHYYVCLNQSSHLLKPVSPDLIKDIQVNHLEPTTFKFTFLQSLEAYLDHIYMFKCIIPLILTDLVFLLTSSWQADKNMCIARDNSVVNKYCWGQVGIISTLNTLSLYQVCIFVLYMSELLSLFCRWHWVQSFLLWRREQDFQTEPPGVHW